MVASTFSGPLISAGPMFGGNSGNSNTPAASSSQTGPCISYQGQSFPDPRYTPMNKDNLVPASIHAHVFAQDNYSVNNIPATAATANIAALANVVNGTPMTLSTTSSAAISANIPILPFKGGAVVVAPICIDYGFQNANATSSSANLTVDDTTKFVVGEPLVVAGVGNAAGTSALLTSVLSITSGTVLVMTNVAQATNATTRVGTGNSWQFLVNGFPANPPTFWHPYLPAGPAYVFDITQALSRGVSISGVLGGAGGIFIVSGWDVYGQPMTQSITVAAGANTVNSTKAFKFINSVTPQFTDAHNYSVGTADTYGFSLRSDYFEDMTIFFNATPITSNTAYIAAVTTSPATSSTGDVRGTIGSGSITANGTKRLVIYQQTPLYNAITATPNATQTLYGVTQV